MEPTTPENANPEETNRPRRGRRGGGRAAKRAQREQANKAGRVSFITRNIPPVSMLNEEGLAVIEANADSILEEIGIEFRDDEDGAIPTRFVPKTHYRLSTRAVHSTRAQFSQ